MTLTIPIDGAALADGALGEPIPVNVPVTIAGQRLVVTEIWKTDATSFAVEIKNVEPDHSGTILARYPDIEPVELTDDLGNEFHLLGAETNCGKSDLATMWADGSTFNFEGSIAAEATQLTMHLENYGKQLRGPWNITLDAPASLDGASR